MKKRNNIDWSTVLCYCAMFAFLAVVWTLACRMISEYFIGVQATVGKLVAGDFK